MDRLLKSFENSICFQSLDTLSRRGRLSASYPCPSLESGLQNILFIADFWRKIGDAAVEDLKLESADGEEISVSLNQVFSRLSGELGNQEDLSLKKKVANDFDLDHFVG